MTRKKTTRKPVRKRAVSKKSGSRLGTFGWVAAAALAVGWMASDGRAVSYVAGLLPAEAPRLASTASHGSERPVQRRPPALEKVPAPVERSRLSAMPRPPRLADAPAQVAAVAPVPAPRPAALRMPRDPAVRASATSQAMAPVPARPVLAPRTAEVPPRRAAPPVAAAAAPAGGVRHATRLLDMRASPDAAGRRVGSVGIGMQVEVLSADGRWRYVRGETSEGWVDGTFLAGESAEAVMPRSPIAPIAMPAAPAARLAQSGPVPPMAIRNR